MEGAVIVVLTIVSDSKDLNVRKEVHTLNVLEEDILL